VRLERVVGASQPGDRVEQNHYSFLYSTNRFAFQHHSATCAWRSGGFVECRTDDLRVDRALKSVTSSAPSSINNPITTASGLFVVIAFAIFCNRIVLPVRGAADNQTALTFYQSGKTNPSRG